MNKRLLNIFSDFKSIDYKKIRSKNFLSRELEYSKRAAVNVMNNSGYRVVEKCDLCGFNQFAWLEHKNEIDIVECEKCGLVISRLIPVEIDDVYSDQDYLDETIDTISKGDEYRKHRFGQERLSIILEHKNEGGRLLDVGCGTGWFIEVSKKYFDCYGVEYSDSLIEYLGNKGIKASKSIDEVHGKFDVITAFDLIEHVPSPRNMLTGIFNNLINDNGILLIYTPNFDSISFYKLGKLCSLLTPPAHLYYFTPLTITKLSKDIGFSVEKVEIAGIDIGDLYAHQLSLGNVETASFLEDNQNWLQYCIDQSDVGNHMRVILRKQ